MKQKPVLSEKLDAEELKRVTSILREMKRDRQGYAVGNGLSVDEVNSEIQRLSDLMKADWILRLAEAEEAVEQTARLSRELDEFLEKLPCGMTVH